LHSGPTDRFKYHRQQVIEGGRRHHVVPPGGTSRGMTRRVAEVVSCEYHHWAAGRGLDRSLNIALNPSSPRRARSEISKSAVAAGIASMTLRATIILRNPWLPADATLLRLKRQHDPGTLGVSNVVVGLHCRTTLKSRALHFVVHHWSDGDAGLRSCHASCYEAILGSSELPP